MTDDKWKLSSKSNKFIQLLLIAVAFGSFFLMVGFLCIVMCAPGGVSEETNKVLNYLVPGLLVVIPLSSIFFMICHAICNSVEKDIMKRGGFNKKLQRYGIIFVTGIDFIIALFFLALTILLLIRPLMILSLIGIIIFAISIVGIVLSITSALCKISIIKLPIIPPNQNNGPYGGPYNGPYGGPQFPDFWSRR